MTLKELKKFNNGQTVKIKEIICDDGGEDGLWTKDIFDDTSEATIFHLGPEGVDVYKTTFIRYERLDGKQEEIRLDRLQKVNSFKDIFDIKGGIVFMVCFLHRSP